jgi:predicted Ser/Thr protein kinase
VLFLAHSSVALVKSFFIPYEEIKIDKELGSGSFGVVYVAEWRNQAVAGNYLYVTRY